MFSVQESSASLLCMRNSNIMMMIITVCIIKFYVFCQLKSGGHYTKVLQYIM